MCNQNCGVGCGGAAGCGSNGSGGGFYPKPLFQVKLPIDSMSFTQQEGIATKARALLKEKLPQLDFIVTNHGVEINRIL